MAVTGKDISEVAELKTSFEEFKSKYNNIDAIESEKGRLAELQWKR